MRKSNKEEFVQKSMNIFGDIFDYSKIIYINSRTPVVLTCKIHGDFTTIPKDHICYKRGCQICTGSKYNTQTIIKKFISVHGNTYLYDRVVYKNIKQSIEIGCKIHGYFWQIPEKHKYGQGCPKCGGRDHKTLIDIIEKSNKIHSNKYNYSKAIFTRTEDKIEIICNVHGSFWQTPSNHIHGKQGCPKCVGPSKLEIEWLNTINIAEKNRQYVIKVADTAYKVDGFDPETNTVYEFYGNYWHGNPTIFHTNDINKTLNKTFGELYHKTIEKEQNLLNAGYQLITMWENNFIEQIKQERR